MVDSNIIFCKILTYYDMVYEISIDKSCSFKQLKEKIMKLDENLNDTKLIYNGRLIRNDDAVISSIVTEINATFYINQAQIHGGCCPKDI